MNETRYLISEAAKITQVEAHVLRYWEEELELPIGRNEMGHRYYTEKDIQTFLNIKELKKKGLQLRAIKEEIHENEKQGEPQTEEKQEKKLPRVVIVKPQRFHIEKEEKAEDRPESEELLQEEKDTRKLCQGKTKEEKFTQIMERLIHDIERSEKKEGRYRRLDETIRRHQLSRKMVAATEDTGTKKGRKRQR